MNTTGPIPILLFSVNEYVALYVARALSVKKYVVYFLGPAGHSIQYSRFCKKYFTIAHTDTALVAQIQNICRKYSISAVIPLDLSTTVCLARLQSTLTSPALPLSHIDTIMSLSNKWKTATLFKEAGLPHPKTVFIRTPLELSDSVLPKPFLIKPLMQEAGNGIRKITSRSDVADYKMRFSVYKTFPIIVQEFINGTDIDFSIVAHDGVIKGWTIQRWKDGSLKFIVDKEVLSVGTRLVRHFRYSGFMHIDMRRDNKSGKLFVLECNTRAWGSIGASIGAGVDFIGLAVQIAQNKPTSEVTQQPTTYTPPVLLLKKSIFNPLRFYHASSDSKHDFISMFTDPLPYIALFVKECIRHIRRGIAFTRGYRFWLIDTERKAYLSHITD